MSDIILKNCKHCGKRFYESKINNDGWGICEDCRNPREYQGVMIHISEKGAKMLGERLSKCERNESLSVEVGGINLLFEIK